MKAQNVDYELPMQPITAMRNSLGKEYGGSGVPLDFEKYKLIFRILFLSKNLKENYQRIGQLVSSIHVYLFYSMQCNFALPG